MMFTRTRASILFLLGLRVSLAEFPTIDEILPDGCSYINGVCYSCNRGEASVTLLADRTVECTCPGSNPCIVETVPQDTLDKIAYYDYELWGDDEDYDDWDRDYSDSSGPMVDQYK
jgi:hypothetical protein